MPVTTPVTISTYAIDGSPLVHVPPAIASLSVVVSPTHKFSVPVIPGGGGFTVIPVVERQPVGSV